MSLIRFLFILAAFIALNFYLFLRGKQALPDRAIIHVIYSVVYIVASLSIFLAVFAANKLPLWVMVIFEQVGGYWMILFVYLLAAALLGDILRVADHYFHIFPSWVAGHYASAKLGYFVFVIAFMVTISLIGFFRFSNPQVVKLSLPESSEKLPGKSYTLVAASDLHLGNVVRKRRLVRWVELINRQKPDIILLAGDIFDHNYEAVEAQRMGDVLAKLKATFGVYAIPGNHDYYTGVDRVTTYMRASGIQVLRDSVAVINNELAVIGRDDLTNRNRKTLASLVEGLDTGLLKIVLDHQPHSLNESTENSIFLHISGHTHNGQVFPFNKIVSRIYKLGYGYQKSGNTNFYVSSGLGLWGAPIRLGTQSEIVSFHIFQGIKP